MVAEGKLEAARPALEEAERALQVHCYLKTFQTDFVCCFVLMSNCIIII